MNRLIKYFQIATAATFDFVSRYVELINIEVDDIVLQVQYSEKGLGPWKVVKEVNEIDYVLKNPAGEEIVVYRGHIRKPDGYKGKAKW